METPLNPWRVEDEYLDHETGHHVIVYRNSVNKAKHVVQVMTKQHCPHCGHVVSLDAEKNLDVDKEKNNILNELNTLHQQEIEYARRRWIRTQ